MANEETAYRGTESVRDLFKLSQGTICVDCDYWFKSNEFRGQCYHGPWPQKARAAAGICKPRTLRSRIKAPRNIFE